MPKVIKGKSTIRLLARIIVLSYCVAIASCVVFVMLHFYKPSQNALGALSSVSMDVICLIILFILICSFSFGKYGKNSTTIIFGVLLLLTVWALFLDFLNWAFDGALEYENMTYWFTIGSLCMGAILACAFSVYLYAYMNETHGLAGMRNSARVCAVLNLVSFVITFILAITKTAFDFKDGHYETGALYDVVAVIPILTILYLTCYAARYVKIIGLHDLVAVAGYILFMIAGALIEAGYNIGTTYVSVAIADIFIFVLLQNEIISKEKRNVAKWIQKSKTDALTGFYNRSAYEEELSLLEVGTLAENFVYCSYDVNSLKYFNDSLGHSAGDELLIGAAQCLKKCVGAYGKLYRIGGDEFVALIYADEKQIENIQRDIVATTKNWSGNLAKTLALSCGYASRKDEDMFDIRQMAILADKRMYADKERFYQDESNADLDQRKKYYKK